MRFGGRPPPRSGWGVPDQFWATPAATRSIPLRVAGTAHWPLGHAWADGYAERDGRWWPRFDPQNVAPVIGAGLCVNAGKIWDQLAPRTDLVLAQRSTIGADRVDQMCAESAVQSARRSVSWPAAHRIPVARRWLICALSAARVRCRRSWAHTAPLPQAGWGERRGDGERLLARHSHG